jgi:hypothetical protein
MAPSSPLVQLRKSPDSAATLGPPLYQDVRDWLLALGLTPMDPHTTSHPPVLRTYTDQFLA